MEVKINISRRTRPDISYAGVHILTLLQRLLPKGSKRFRACLVVTCGRRLVSAQNRIVDSRCPRGCPASARSDTMPLFSRRHAEPAAAATTTGDHGRAQAGLVKTFGLDVLTMAALGAIALGYAAYCDLELTA
jgi:hypothetical protein